MLQWEVTVSPSEHLVDTVKNTVIFSGYQQMLLDSRGQEDMKKARFYAGFIILLDFWEANHKLSPAGSITCHFSEGLEFDSLFHNRIGNLERCEWAHKIVGIGKHKVAVAVLQVW